MIQPRACEPAARPRTALTLSSLSSSLPPPPPCPRNRRDSGHGTTASQAGASRTSSPAFVLRDPRAPSSSTSPSHTIIMTTNTGSRKITSMLLTKSSRPSTQSSPSSRETSSNNSAASRTCAFTFYLLPCSASWPRRSSEHLCARAGRCYLFYSGLVRRGVEAAYMVIRDTLRVRLSRTPVLIPHIPNTAIQSPNLTVHSSSVSHIISPLSIHGPCCAHDPAPALSPPSSLTPECFYIVPD